VIWRNLSSVKASGTNEPYDFDPQVGATIPDNFSVQPLPDDVTKEAPSLEGYGYTMVRKEIVIVNPTSKKIVDIINEQ
jgi:hypothetical protein